MLVAGWRKRVCGVCGGDVGERGGGKIRGMMGVGRGV